MFWRGLRFSLIICVIVCNEMHWWEWSRFLCVKKWLSTPAANQPISSLQEEQVSVCADQASGQRRHVDFHSVFNNTRLMQEMFNFSLRLCPVLCSHDFSLFSVQQQRRQQRPHFASSVSSASRSVSTHWISFYTVFKQTDWFCCTLDRKTYAESLSSSVRIVWLFVE